MKIIEKDDKGYGYLVLKADKDLEKFRKMLIEAYYELMPYYRPSYR